MVRRMNYLGIVGGLAAAIALGACGGTTNNDGGGDGGGDAPPTTHSYTFVVDQLTIDMSDSTGVSHTGFNLDTLFSGPTDSNGCNHQDFVSSHDSDQDCPAAMTATDGSGHCNAMPNPGCSSVDSTCTGGVDNQLPTLANTIQTAAMMDIRMALANLVSHNQVSLIVRIRNITDDMNSTGVNIDVFQGYPTFSMDCTTVMPGRHYNVSATSVMNMDMNMPVYTFAGSIVNGRVQIAQTSMGSGFTLPLPPIMGMMLNLTMFNLNMRADLNATGMTLERGDLGGYVRGNQIRDLVCMAAPMYCSVVMGAIGGLIDIELNPTTGALDPVMGVCDMAMGSMHNYGGIGLGLGVHGVQAIIDGVAAARAPGACGAPSGG